MKINEVISADPQAIHVKAMKNIADNAKKQAKIASANLKLKKAKEQVMKAQQDKISNN